LLFLCAFAIDGAVAFVYDRAMVYANPFTSASKVWGFFGFYFAYAYKRIES